MSQGETVAEVLDRAADEIVRSGHHKGWYSADGGDPTSPCCALGAIRRVTKPGTADHVGTMFWSYLKSTGWEGGVGAWNDAPGRTAEEVIAALRAAAEREEVIAALRAAAERERRGE